MNLIKVVIFVFTFTLSLGSIVFAQDQENIKWSSDRPIIWDDFKGDCDSIGFFGAQLSRGTFFNCIVWPDGSFEYELYAFMNPNISCFNLKADDILEHERTHFDICEYWARVCRKMITQYIDSANIIDGEVMAAFVTNTRKPEEEMQKQYDIETNYSRNEAKQEEWTEKVRKLLEEMKDYAEPEE